VNSLSREQIDTLKDTWEAVKGSKLQTLANIEADETRKKIDEAFRSALNLPDISVLREMLSQEPIIRLTSEAGAQPE
jgi:hypothetical protein